MFKEYKEELEKNNTEIKKLSMMLAIAILFLVPLSIFFINAYAQTAPPPPSTSDQLSGIVASATLLIGTITAILILIKKIFTRLNKANIISNEMYAKIADVLDTVSGSLEQTDKGIRDNMDVVGLAIGSILNNPEIKNKLGTAESQAILTKIQVEIDAWNRDIRKYYETINPKVPNDEGDETNTTMKLAKVKAKSIPQ